LRNIIIVIVFYNHIKFFFLIIRIISNHIFTLSHLFIVLIFLIMLIISLLIFISIIRLFASFAHIISILSSNPNSSIIQVSTSISISILLFIMLILSSIIEYHPSFFVMLFVRNHLQLIFLIFIII